MSDLAAISSSPEYWSITGTDGQEISLHLQGWSVTTVGGSRYDLPPRRGSDMVMAYRPGQIHRRKLPDARQITLVMFMVGWDPVTGAASGEQRLRWNDNWDQLRRLVYRNYLLNDQRIRLTRRWKLTPPTFPTTRTGDICIQGDPGVPDAGPRLTSAFAWAEMSGSMAPTMTGRFRADFQLDFTLADPFFYGDTVTTTLQSGETAYVWNDGHDVAASGYMQVDLVGPLTNPVLTNLSTEPDSWVKYGASIGSGEIVRLVINRFTCDRITGTVTNRIGFISNYGARSWVSMLPGVNKLRLTGGGSGHAIVTFRPPYV